MSLPILPTEVWVIVFEQLDLPTPIRVLRREHFKYVRSATRKYEAGNFQAVSQLPKFERFKWLGMRKFYNIDKSIREAAARAKLSERWFNSFEAVVDSSSFLDIAVTRRSKKSYVRGRGLVEQAPQLLHGSLTPVYLGLNLYSRRYDTDRAVYESMNDAKNRFIDFAVANPVFSTLRTIDLIVRITQEEQVKARRHLDTITSCANIEWNGLNVRNGVIRVFWEIVEDPEQLSLEEIDSEDADNEDVDSEDVDSEDVDSGNMSSEASSDEADDLGG